MQSTARLLLSTIGTLLLAGAAHATTISQSHIINSQTLNINNGQTSNFNKFDTSLGELSEVKITYTLQVTGGNLIVDNDGESSIDVAYDATLSATLTDSAFSVFLPGDSTALLDTLAGIANLGPEDGDGAGVIDSGSPDGALISLVGLLDTSVTSFTSGAFFDSYKTSTAGTFNLEYTANRDFNIDAGAAEGGFTTTSVEGSILVEYTYAPIPEPSTALLGSLGALMLLRRRRAA